MTIRNNTFEEISGAAIHEYQSGGSPASDGWEISGNVFRKPVQFTTPTGKGYYVELILWARDGNQVFDNEFHGEGKRSGVSLRSGNNRISNNKFIRCKTVVDPGKGSGNVVRDNVVQ